MLVSQAAGRVSEHRCGRSLVRLMNAGPDVPELKGAAFTPGEKGVYRDKQRGGDSIGVPARKGDGCGVEVVNGE